MIEPLEKVSEWEQALVKGEHDIGVHATRSSGGRSVTAEFVSLSPLCVDSTVKLTLVLWQVEMTPSLCPARLRPETPHRRPRRTCPPI